MFKGKCFSCKDNDAGCAIMGLNTVRPNHAPGSKYFISTGKDTPYCSKYIYKKNIWFLYIIFTYFLIFYLMFILIFYDYS